MYKYIFYVNRWYNEMKMVACELNKVVKESKKYLLCNIPKNSENKFNEKVFLSNNIRTTTICLVFIVLTLLQLTFQNIKETTSYSVHIAYRNLSYINLVTVFICLAYLLIINIVSIERQLKKIKFYESLLFIFVLSMLVLNTLTSINAQLYQGDITGFIITMFVFSIGSILKPSKNICIYLFNFVLLITGLLFLDIYEYKFYAQIFNGFLTTIFAIILSIVNYYYVVKNFIQKTEILNKAQELENYKNHLEELVKIRTADLVKTNDKLLDEVTIRHKAELESIKSNIRYKEKERLLNKAVEYEKLRTEFFANISHELRTPLNVIFCAEQMLDMIVNNDNKDDQIRINKYLFTIKQNSYRLLRLINNLIDITKMDAGYFEVTLSNNDIIKIVEDITLSVAEYAHNKNINLIFDTEEEEKIIACDPDKIERIVLNLLSNSIKFTPADGSIYVNMYMKNSKVVISVKDSGIGIDNNMQKLIFERFIQVDKSTSRRNEGSGIGLSLVKSLVEMHNGHISVTSEFGKGSEFRVELPDVQIQTPIPKIESFNVNESKKNIEMINLEFSDIYF